MTRTERLADYLAQRANTWVDGIELSTVGGRYGWRSRVSDARRKLGLRIDNRQRKVGSRTVSEYRLVTPTSLLDLMS